MPSKSKTKQLPHAEEVERAVLGALLIDSQKVESVRKILRGPDDFYLPENQAIYEAILNLTDGNSPVDLLTTIHELKRIGRLSDVGGEVYVVGLTNHVTSAANVDAHAFVVSERAIARRIYTSSSGIANRSLDPSEDPFELLEQAKVELDSVFTLKQGHETRSLSAIVDDAQDFLSTLELEPEKLGIINFGFTDIDRVTGGCLPGDLIVVGGKRKSGKTTLTIQTALFNAGNGVPCGIFSQEMSSLQICLRGAFFESGVSFTRALDGKLSDFEKDSLLKTLDRFRKLPIYVNDRESSIENICFEAARMRRVYGIKLVVVDYLQLTRPTTFTKNESREQQVASISRSLKHLAKDQQIVVFALSQLNKDSESRESRGIEADADKLVYVDAHEDDPVPVGNTGKDVDLKIVQRFGPSGGFGDVKLYYDLTVGAFRNHSNITQAAAQPDELPF